MSRRTQHVGAGVPLSRLPVFDPPAVPTLLILNVIRVALDRADMNHRTTGIKDFELEAAKAWVRSRIVAATFKEPTHAR